MRHGIPTWICSAESLNEVERWADELWALASDATRRVLDDIVARSIRWRRIPTPTNWPPLSTLTTPDLGRLNCWRARDLRSLRRRDGVGNTVAHRQRPEGDRADWLPADEPAGNGLNDRALNSTQHRPTRRPGTSATSGSARIRRVGKGTTQRRLRHPSSGAELRRSAGDIVDRSSTGGGGATGGGSSRRLRRITASSSWSRPMQDPDRISVFLTGDILLGDEVVGGIVGRTSSPATIRTVSSSKMDRLSIDPTKIVRGTSPGDRLRSWSPTMAPRSPSRRRGDRGRRGGAAVCTRLHLDPIPPNSVNPLAQYDASPPASWGARSARGPRAVLRDVVESAEPAHQIAPRPDRSVSTARNSIRCQAAGRHQLVGAKYRPPTDATGHPRRARCRSGVPVAAGRVPNDAADARQVDARYTQPLGDVVDNASPAADRPARRGSRRALRRVRIEFEGYVDSSGRSYSKANHQ